MTPWILFVIFAFGPCEPLIPLFIYPAATSGWTGAWVVAVTFSVVTIGAMLAIVLAVGRRAGLGHTDEHAGRFRDTSRGGEQEKQDDKEQGEFAHKVGQHIK